MSGHPVARAGLRLATALVLVLLVPEAQAGGRGRFVRRGQVPSNPVSQPSAVYPTARTVTPAPRPTGTLGTFTATPYIWVRGNGPAGGGYSPLGEFGDSTMSLYGPLSGLRTTSAPVLTYSRGYNGQTAVTPGTSFSTPNLPPLTPVIYPTQASNYFGFRQSGEPPWWPNAINWIDQN